ncbi:MAG TPA: anthranilate phosphoribosyltransferase [Oligoflexia bacterium]|nr:anthranilate phosphoribosyltransferase [Oligoflexia bacterium]
MISHSLRKVARGEVLDAEESYALFSCLAGAGAEVISDAQIGAYLLSTAMRSIQSPELIGGAKCLREQMVKVPVKLMLPGIETLDTCGTGGSGLQTFNTSTAVALVCAAAGQYVAKHGNRGATSGCGSIDLLETLGVKCELPPEQIARCLEKTGFCVIFAPKHHPATARVGRIRRELGIPTIFNFLGPLVNPAGSERQLLGVSRRQMVQVMAEALSGLGTKRAMVVCGEDGLDEITLNGRTEVCEVNGTAITKYFIEPGDYGFPPAAAADIRGGTPAVSAQIMQRIFSGESGAHLNLVLLNAGAALYVGGQSGSIQEGIAKARQCIDSGKAAEKLAEVIRFTANNGMQN